jgi:hypothetical protein
VIFDLEHHYLFFPGSKWFVIHSASPNTLIQKVFDTLVCNASALKAGCYPGLLVKYPDQFDQVLLYMEGLVGLGLDRRRRCFFRGCDPG